MNLVILPIDHVNKSFHIIYYMIGETLFLRATSERF